MVEFKVHTQETAPDDAKPLLEGAAGRFGFVPNLVGMMAESPLALKGYFTLGQMLADGSSFSPAEQQILWLTISRANDCHYCVAAHSTGAAKAKVNEDVIAAIRNETAIDDPRLEALRQFSTRMVATRGWVGDDAAERFIAAGFEKSQVLEIILFVAHKSISNYANHLAQTPVDAAFTQRTWKKAG